MKDIKRLHELFKNAELFSSLDDKYLKLLEEKMNFVTYESDEIICSEGDIADRMYLVDKGQIKVLKKGNRDIFVEITTLKSGEIAGIMSIFEEETRSATLKACGKTDIWHIDKKTFQCLLDSHPLICRSLLSILSSNLRRETKIVAELSSRDIENRLKIAMFDSKPYTEKFFREQNGNKYAIKYFQPRLDIDTVSLAKGFKVICAFVNDRIDREVVEKLSNLGVEMIALRCAGYNNVDLKACQEFEISVARVPEYSPYSVAEHAVALIMALNRHIQRAHLRVREGNFSLNGLVGFDIHAKTTGIIGTGKIGKCLINILLGFGCKILAYDKYIDKNLSEKQGVEYVDLDTLLNNSDIISLHAPLTKETYHMINDETIGKMKKGVLIINTSRGGLIDTQALIRGLLSEQIGHAGLDVYEEESGYFFEDMSDTVIADDILARLTTFNNVMITSHMAFLTKDALENITKTTLNNINEYENGKRGKDLPNAVYFT